MNLLNGFINKGSDESLLKSLFTMLGLNGQDVVGEELEKAKKDKSKLIPKQVLAHGPNGPYITTVYVSPEDFKNSGPLSAEKQASKPKEQPKKKSMAQAYRDTFIGLKTALGGTIKSIDEAHFFKRVATRKPKMSDIKEALENPVHTQRGSNANGSTEYWGRKFIVIVKDGGNPKSGGELKTCYIIELEKIDRLNNYIKEQEEKQKK